MSTGYKIATEKLCRYGFIACRYYSWFLMQGVLIQTYTSCNGQHVRSSGKVKNNNHVETQTVEKLWKYRISKKSWKLLG